jgi:hypothetical protein
VGIISLFIENFVHWQSIPPKTMKTARRLSVLILLTASVLALYGGIHLIIDPTGNSLHIPYYLLSRTFFRDYMLIGYIIALTIGCFSLFLVVCILLKTNYYSVGLMLQGVIICMYTFIMMLLAGNAVFVEYIFLALGTLMIALGVWQYQRKITVEARKKE